MPWRARRVVVTVAFAAALAGCLGPGRATFVSTLPGYPNPGGVTPREQPVNLVDLTGIVVRLEGTLPSEDDWDTTSDRVDPARPVPGDPSALRVAWIGGACESRTHLLLTPAGDAYRLRVRADSTIGGMIGCPAVGIPRAAILHLREPIDPTRVTISWR